MGRAWVFCVPVNRGPGFPEWHALLLQMENCFPFPLSQPLCVCVLSHSDSLRPMDCSPPGSSVHGIFQVRTLGWVAISCSGGSSQPRDCTCISYVDRQILYFLSHQGSPSQVKSVHNHCQRFHTRCSALALTLIPKDEASSYLPKEKYHIIFCTRSQK